MALSKVSSSCKAMLLSPAHSVLMVSKIHYETFSHGELMLQTLLVLARNNHLHLGFLDLLYTDHLNQMDGQRFR
jgi:hypothetical protein